MPKDKDVMYTPTPKYEPKKKQEWVKKPKKSPFSNGDPIIAPKPKPPKPHIGGK